MENDYSPVVLLVDEGVLGVVLSYGAHVSEVMFFKNGLRYNIMLENDEFIELGDFD